MLVQIFTEFKQFENDDGGILVVFDVLNFRCIELVSRGSTATSSTRRIYERVPLSSVLLLLACSEDTNQHVECVHSFTFDSILGWSTPRTSTERTTHTVCLCECECACWPNRRIGSNNAVHILLLLHAFTHSKYPQDGRTEGRGVCVCLV